YGRTPLWRAASAGNKAIVQLLLENGANIETADSQGRTPLQIAAYRCHDRVERVLLAHGACDVDSLGLQALFLEVGETDGHSIDSA
ncbi:ankyrin repeat domain-containing protein, partial [Listeria monocytogenes]|uniref:ankyrin repeat domain-containing protein n=1 Tax=Listeria monocytogenes TaxID=1639 RepID=UPI003C6DA410